MANGNSTNGPSRRAFLKAGMTTAAVAGLPLGARAMGPEAKDADAKDAGAKGELPRRVLGRTGEKVSMINLGTAGGASARLLNATWDEGVRYLDTADCYANGASETSIATWLEKNGRRKSFFIVTKDHPDTPEEWVKMVDTRLEALKTDYIDLFFIHGLGEGGRGGGEQSHRDIPKSKDWKAAAERMKKSGKVRFTGFSTHTDITLRSALLRNAASGGWVDAIMVATDPQVVRTNAEFNKALDECHKAGVGLISMKEMRGAQHAPKFMPEFEAMGLTPQQAVLQAVWSDERFASICSNMPNLRLLAENTESARKYTKPLDKKQIGMVLELYERYAINYCNGCNGDCGRAAGTQAALGDIVRYLAYHEADGQYEEARRLYGGLSQEQRDWHGANLQAATQACANKLDFARLLPRADEKLA